METTMYTAVPETQQAPHRNGRMESLPHAHRAGDRRGFGDRSWTRARRRCVELVTLTTSLALAAAVFAVPSALAAAPEAPSAAEVEPVTQATTAFVHGLLNPGKTGAPGSFELGSYEFLYRASKTECEGGDHAPSSPGMSLGGGREEVQELIEGLTPGTEYTVCLLARNDTGTETSVGAPAHFRTAIAPEVPETNPATEVTGSTAKLNGLLNPTAEGEASSYLFVYSASSTECRVPGQTRETAELPALGHRAEAVSADVSSLLPTTTYTFCLLVFNGGFEEAESSGETFTTGTAPATVSEESVANLGATEVTVSAEIDPGGAPTTYEVEYEPGKRTPQQSLPASRVPVTVTQSVTGLQPGVEYHFHFIARNELGPVEGAEESFTTSAAVPINGPPATGCPNSALAGYSATLPDCRAYELVSGATEVGEVYPPGGEISQADRSNVMSRRASRAAADGSGVAYVADPGPVGGDGSSALGFGNEYLATRGPLSGLQGWEVSNITPPVAEGESASLEREYVAFSDDLSIGIVASEQPLLGADPSPQAPQGCGTLYSRSSGAGAGSVFGSEYHALFSETLTPQLCGLPESIAGQENSGMNNTQLFAGEASDHDQKLFQTPAPLVSPAVEAEGVGGNLYDSSGGALTVVNRLPTGALDPNATFGGPSELPDNSPDLSGAISADGSRVFWSTLEPAAFSEGEGGRTSQPQALYATENPSSPSATTVQLDLAQAGAPEAGGGGQFWAASSNGSRAFFTDCHRLTRDSTASSSAGCGEQLVGSAGNEDQAMKIGNDLYAYDFAKPAGERLTDLTVDLGDSLGADVQGVIGVSEDGDYVYFVAGGALDRRANAHGETASTRRCETSPPSSQPGEAGYEEAHGHLPPGKGCNLYVEHNNGLEWGKPRFIAAVALTDGLSRVAVSGGSLNNPRHEDFYGDWAPDLGSRTAEVSPDGRHVVFQSAQQFTGYDNVPAGNEGVPEVFVYDAETQGLSCASCDPAGAPPVATTAGKAGKVTDPPTYLPVSTSGTYLRRWMNAQGTEVFFDSSEPLVAGERVGVQEVYEWEAEGGPSCPRSTSRYGGCVFLLSGGEGTDLSFFVDADQNGENVFLTHRGQLGGVGPLDRQEHLFDVRVDGGFPDTALACTGTGCQGVPPASPQFATPSSATFNGLGNFPAPTPPKAKTAARIRTEKLSKALKHCKKDKKKRKRTKCEMAARKQYGATKAKKSAKANWRTAR
jgi:Fibronectin type III domain